MLSVCYIGSSFLAKKVDIKTKFEFSELVIVIQIVTNKMCFLKVQDK